MRVYAEALNGQNRACRAQVELDRKTLEKIERGIAGIMAAIEDGRYQPAMKDRMEELERQKADVLARMEQAPEDVPDSHPNIAEVYKAKVTQLSEALTDPELCDQAAEAFRALVDEVVLEPGDKRGKGNATLRGEVMNIIDIVAGRKIRDRSQVITKDVAGPRNHIKPWQRVGWVIPPRGNANFAAAMEKVLDVYRRPYGATFPVVCMDETPRQLIQKRACRSPVSRTAVCHDCTRCMAVHGCRDLGRQAYDQGNQAQDQD